MSSKKFIRLTESDLHRVVKESVKKILREFADLGDTDKRRHWEIPSNLGYMVLKNML